MAHINGEIGNFSEYSDEDNILKCLSKLSDDYYVIHSLRNFNVKGKMLDESEADFFIFNPKYGCLIIEEKGGKVTRNSEGKWFYQNGLAMNHDPFDQAVTSMYKLRDAFLNKNPSLAPLVRKCKFMFAVWLPSYTRDEIKNASFGPNVCKELILTKETKEDPTADIENIMKNMQKMHVEYNIKEITNVKGYSHDLSKEESMKIFREVFCPSFDLVASTFDYDFEEKVYIHLLKEQKIVLDFLSEQKSAAINGAAGTGKTLVAFERAKELNSMKEKVLFLCYNKNLCEFLSKKGDVEGMEYVDFYTIDGLACKYAKLPYANYVIAKKVIEELILSEEFGYKHIIVDEGQDFGREDILNSNILETLAYYGGSNDYEDTTFFIFYDKNQMIQSSDIPKYIKDVDSKLTLYKNCRNTKKIAASSLAIINQKENTYKLAIEGKNPSVYFYETEEELLGKLDKLIEKISDNKNNRAILTTKTILQTSINSRMNKEDKYVTENNKKTNVFTCKTFKGLEADNIILVDVDFAAFDNNILELYVGMSRAKKDLYIFMKISELEAEKILKKYFPEISIRSSCKLSLMRALNCLVAQ